MKRVSVLLAALATIAVAAPSVANAQGFSVGIGSDRYYDRDYHRDYYRGPRAGSRLISATYNTLYQESRLDFAGCGTP